jgi:hypothetical protein
MAYNLVDGTTYQINTIPASDYVVQVGNNGVIAAIDGCIT